MCCLSCFQQKRWGRLSPRKYHLGLGLSQLHPGRCQQQTPRLSSSGRDCCLGGEQALGRFSCVSKKDSSRDRLGCREP